MRASPRPPRFPRRRRRRQRSPGRRPGRRPPRRSAALADARRGVGARDGTRARRRGRRVHPRRVRRGHRRQKRRRRVRLSRARAVPPASAASPGTAGTAETEETRLVLAQRCASCSVAGANGAGAATAGEEYARIPGPTPETRGEDSGAGGAKRMPGPTPEICGDAVASSRRTRPTPRRPTRARRPNLPISRGHRPSTPSPPRNHHHHPLSRRHPRRRARARARARAPPPTPRPSAAPRPRARGAGEVAPSPPRPRLASASGVGSNRADMRLRRSSTPPPEPPRRGPPGPTRRGGRRRKAGAPPRRLLRSLLAPTPPPRRRAAGPGAEPRMDASEGLRAHRRLGPRGDDTFHAPQKAKKKATPASSPSAAWLFEVVRAVAAKRRRGAPPARRGREFGGKSVDVGPHRADVPGCSSGVPDHASRGSWSCPARPGASSPPSSGMVVVPRLSPRGRPAVPRRRPTAATKSAALGTSATRLGRAEFFGTGRPRGGSLPTRRPGTSSSRARCVPRHGILLYGGGDRRVGSAPPGVGRRRRPSPRLWLRCAPPPPRGRSGRTRTRAFGSRAAASAHAPRAEEGALHPGVARGRDRGALERRAGGGGGHSEATTREAELRASRGDARESRKTRRKVGTRRGARGAGGAGGASPRGGADEGRGGPCGARSRVARVRDARLVRPAETTQTVGAERPVL